MGAEPRSIVGDTIRIFGFDAALADADVFDPFVDAPLRWPDLPHDAAAGDLQVDQLSPLLCVDQAHPHPPRRCRVCSIGVICCSFVNFGSIHV